MRDFMWCVLLILRCIAAERLEAYLPSLAADLSRSRACVPRLSGPLSEMRESVNKSVVSCHCSSVNLALKQQQQQQLTLIFLLEK